MKAITRRHYGAPDLLRLDAVADPEPAADEVLVEVRAAGVNQGDLLGVRGWPYVTRLTGSGLLRPRHPVPGTDVAGRVVAVGADVVDAAPGDDVVGWASSGAFAELATMPAGRLVARPEALGDDEAAAVPTPGVAALQALRAAGPLAPDDEVLVIGASGSVGSFAVQLAAAAGARVVGVAGARNAEVVRSLGAAEVIDHVHEEVPGGRGRYAVIVDMVGAQSLGDLRRGLRRSGTLVVVGGRHPRTLTGMRRFATAAALSPLVPQRLVPLFSTPDVADLAELISLVEAGLLRPLIGRTFALPETAAALELLESGRARGRTVVTL